MLALSRGVALVSILLLGGVVIGWAQEEGGLSKDRGFGLGWRFAPPVPIVSGLDPALGSAIIVQYWISNQIGIEFGGWISVFPPEDNSRNFTSISGGILLKFFDSNAVDLYVAGRAIGLQVVNKYELLSPGPYQESRTFTLALEVAAGIEWSWSPHVTTNLELGFAYAQMLEKPPQPGPVPPTSLLHRSDVSSSNFGVMLHLGVNFYLLRARKQAAD